MIFSGNHTEERIDERSGSRGIPVGWGFRRLLASDRVPGPGICCTLAASAVFRLNAGGVSAQLLTGSAVKLSTWMLTDQSEQRFF